MQGRQIFRNERLRYGSHWWRRKELFGLLEVSGGREAVRVTVPVGLPSKRQNVCADGANGRIAKKV